MINKIYSFFSVPINDFIVPTKMPARNLPAVGWAQSLKRWAFYPRIRLVFY
ncbi:hypothetical protein BB560_001756, partial [Smittium megazygosporum]